MVTYKDLCNLKICAFQKWYVPETITYWQSLKELDDEAAKQALAPLVKKIELALVTIAQFQQSLSKS
ncbi:MAG: hypothetical protein CMC15_00455 [Flavobacteriaceae bacterium]|nr:hypothetical protein [Flavobacteriaceae bacterium]